MCAFVVRYHPGVYCTKFIVCLFGLTFRSHHVCSGDASVVRLGEGVFKSRVPEMRFPVFLG
jgi:hypothetical protein